MKTDYKAPNGRILKADPGIMPDAWKTIVPEGPDAIEDCQHCRRQDLCEAAEGCEDGDRVYTLDGKASRHDRVRRNRLGHRAVDGRTTDRYGYFSFESFIVPPTIYRLDTMTGKREVFAQPKVPFDSSQYELKQVFFKSKDGTQVPMFIAGKKGLKQDGTERLLMTGYGGFDVSMTAGMESRVGLVDGAGRLVCAAQSARRRRVRRELARAGNV